VTVYEVPVHLPSFDENTWKDVVPVVLEQELHKTSELRMETFAQPLLPTVP
jgi:hypothetical protein